VKKRPLTIKELASKLHLSVSTVSKALNNYDTINPGTKIRVKEMARELNFVPDGRAVSFRKRRSNTIGVIVPTMNSERYALALSGIEEFAMKHNYKVIIGQSNEEPSREKELIDNLMRFGVDGVLIAMTKNTIDYEFFRGLEEERIPFVHFLRRPPISCISVLSDLGKGILKSVAQLNKLGHNRVGHILGPFSLQTTIDLGDDIHIEPEMVAISNLTEESNDRAIRSLFSSGQEPTAIIAYHDHILFDLLDFIKRENRNTVVIGAGNPNLLRHFGNPVIGCFQEQFSSIGQTAFDLLMKKIDRTESQSLLTEQLDCRLHFFHS
jgi:DNA-binding LacI/PurR family transcriptional regulator